MRLLIATPCLTGFTQNYVSSLVGMIEGLTRSDIHYRTIFIAQESFIQVARNDYMHYALTSAENFTHLMFIDSDIGWEWEDFRALTRADREVISGLCPYKKYPIEFVYNPIPDRSTPDWEGLIPVRHAPTGFMLIKLAEMHRIKTGVETYKRRSAITGKKETIWNFFAAGINGDEFETEDWGFSSLLQHKDIQPYIHTKVLTSHAGIHTFRVEVPK